MVSGGPSARLLAAIAPFRVVIAGLLALPAALVFAAAGLVAAASFFWTLANLVGAGFGNPRALDAAAASAATCAAAAALAAAIFHFGGRAWRAARPGAERPYRPAAPDGPR